MLKRERGKQKRLYKDPPVSRRKEGLLTEHEHDDDVTSVIDIVCTGKPPSQSVGVKKN